MADAPKSVPKQDVGIKSASVQGIAEGVADAAAKLASAALGKTEDQGPAAGQPSGEAADGGKKKDPKADKKAERMAKREAQAAAAKAASSEVDPLAENYGDMPTVQSRSISGQKWTPVRTLTSDLDKQEVLIRGRVHTVRAKGKSAFLVVREKGATVQVVFFVDEKTVSKQMVKYISGLSKESIVDVTGVVSVPPEPLASTTQQVELSGRKIFAVNKAAPQLPISVEDAARSEQQIAEGEKRGEQYVRVTQDTRLNNRVIDLRTPANQGIFRIQSQVSQLFREYLLSQKFVEIHTPKLTPGSSEGGASVFQLQYLGQPACLAQSPQLYKQMAIMADLGRVFEVGPVFRAEKSFTHRHLTEFTGLDFEMEIKEHYSEVLDVVDGLFVHIFEGINARCKEELESVDTQYPFEPLQFLPNGCRIQFAEGIRLLHAAGFADADPHGDLSTELERELGKIVKEKYHTDFYILTDFPIEARPFYTMPSPTDPRYTNSFDVFIRGEEIISGAQRIHEPELLAKRAAECGIDVKTISTYIDAFKYGALPHGGAGVGLERVVMLFLALNNIRKTSMFPRDPQRLTP